MKKLILFDIDGILIRSVSTGSTPYLMKKYFDIEPFETKVYMEGKTYRWILRERLIEAGIENPEENPKFLEALNDITSVENAVKDGIKIEKIARVEDLIKELKDKGHVVGLLTGNTEKSAKIKLEFVDLWKYFDFGAFGSETCIRSELVPLAMEDAKSKTGIEFEKDQVYLVGDTIADIECAKQSGVKIISVATGLESMEKLNSENPDFLFKDFNNSKEMLNVMGI